VKASVEISLAHFGEPWHPAGKAATILIERRGFLRALAGLPFIGGGVTLIGR